MHVVHVSRWHLPVTGYGGVPRVLFWLAKAQAEQGDRVTILGPPGMACPGVTCISVPVPAGESDYSPYVAARLPDDADIVHFQHHPSLMPALPWVLTQHGNGHVANEGIYKPHLVYVSRDHAARHGSDRFVYNGIDAGEFVFRERKEDYFLFLSKVSLPKKGVDVAVRLARELGFRLVVAGGTRFGLRKTGGLWDSLRGDIHFCGEVSDKRKADLIAGARGLIFPIRWEEPFGLVVTEALVSGTPVITTPRGAMGEIITPEVGFLCDSYHAFREAVRHIDDVDPNACRHRVLEHFTNHHSADAYRHYYQEAMATPPRAAGAA